MPRVIFMADAVARLTGTDLNLAFLKREKDLPRVSKRPHLSLSRERGPLHPLCLLDRKDPEEDPRTPMRPLRSALEKNVYQSPPDSQGSRLHGRRDWLGLTG